MRRVGCRVIGFGTLGMGKGVVTNHPVYYVYRNISYTGCCYYELLRIMHVNERYTNEQYTTQ